MSVSPNARGLQHKNTLHLASARGHSKVVEFLIMNGVRVVGSSEGMKGEECEMGEECEGDGYTCC